MSSRRSRNGGSEIGLSRSKALSESIVGVDTSDKLTDPQIVAKVKEHYGIDR